MAARIMVRAFFHERLCALDQQMCSSANAVNLIRRASRVLAIAGDLAELVKRQETARLVETSDGGFKVADLVFHRKGQPLGDFRRAWHAALFKAGFAHSITDANDKVITRKDGSPQLVYTKPVLDRAIVWIEEDEVAATSLFESPSNPGVALAVGRQRLRDERRWSRYLGSIPWNRGRSAEGESR